MVSVLLVPVLQVFAHNIERTIAFHFRGNKPDAIQSHLDWIPRAE